MSVSIEEPSNSIKLVLLCQKNPALARKLFSTSMCVARIFFLLIKIPSLRLIGILTKKSIFFSSIFSLSAWLVFLEPVNVHIVDFESLKWMSYCYSGPVVPLQYGNHSVLPNSVDW